MQVGDLVRILFLHRSMGNPIGIITNITWLRGKAFIEVNTGDHVYRRYPSQLEAL